ncbi:MAG: hypothetical protein ABH824_01210 [Nanoarchaeota archaeon]|nr:hypothetical protein [Nanoarchaeota archaeon]MBU1632237.1 hypothetical protein [Nanoarchaeota archaeon]MBU1875760.1 hypothetical protein [Nanoarchaeota archaeon]
MATERKTSNKKYLLALFLTLVVFSGGIVLGIFIENARVNYTQQISLEEKVNLRSLQLQQNYIDSGFANCNTLHQILEHNIDELGAKMGMVLEYEKKSLFNEKEFNLQLQDYFLTEIQFYLISEEIDKKCPIDNVKILYFYDENKYETQGDILAYLKKKFGSRLLVFSLNSDFKQEPMINILLTSYNIKEFPAIVIDKKAYQGHRNVEQLMEDICDEFSNMKTVAPEECKSFKKELATTTKKNTNLS